MSNCANVDISHNIIRYNRSGFYQNFMGEGAGIWAAGGTISYNLIYGNEVRSVGHDYDLCGYGGGIYIDTGEEGCGSVKVINNTITANIALKRPTGDGGGIYVYTGIGYRDTVLIVNNIIANNNRGGLYCPFGGNINYNLFYGDSSYDIIEPDTSETNIFSDPLIADSLNGNYSLLPNSPCIDAGDPSSPLDPDSTRADIGALFFDQSVNIDDDRASSGPYAFELRQNYPNPFNAQTNISYYLPKASVVSFRIYDLTGRVVRRLIRNEEESAGSHRLLWDGADESGHPVSTAIYLYELKVGDQKQVKSMIVIK